MKIVAILACSSRAGVDFFQSLLDNHPEISQFPGALNFDEFIKEIELIKDPEVIAELFIKKFEKFFDSRKNLLERLIVFCIPVFFMINNPISDLLASKTILLKSTGSTIFIFFDKLNELIN